MAAVRIICVGNRLVAGDDLGPRVHDLLAGGELPAGVELVDGGLKGLDLLHAVEGCRRVVFVDALSGFGAPGTVTALSRDDVAALAEGPWGHGAGLPHLFAIAPKVLDGATPDMLLVGSESDGRMDAAVAARALAEASRT